MRAITTWLASFPHPARPWQMPRHAGFTLIEIMISLIILGLLVMIGVPAMSPMIQNARLSSMSEFYLDGLRIARSGAIQKSAAARFVMTPNANGQFDWQVNWCFPTTVSPCDTSGNWSTTTAAASNDTNTANPSLSIFRSANGLPNASRVTMYLTPVGATALYFNAYGWINTNVPPVLTLICMDVNGNCITTPSTPPEVPPRAISINLSGVAERCDPLAVSSDSRTCAP